MQGRSSVGDHCCRGFAGCSKCRFYTFLGIIEGEGDVHSKGFGEGLYGGLVSQGPKCCYDTTQGLSEEV